MKFELTEPGKQISKFELIRDLQRVASTLKKKSVTLKEYQKYGNYSYQTQKKRFGSWKKALLASKLQESRRPWGGDLSESRIPTDILFEDMKRVSEKLKKKEITSTEYDAHGKYGSSTISKRFNGWNKAKIKAGLKIGRSYNISEKDLFDNLLHIWERLGRQPKYREIEAPLSKIHISTYERKFGSWYCALERFVDYINNKEDTTTPRLEMEVDIKSYPTQTDPVKELLSIKRTNRTANLRQRFRVMKRDNFKCVLCGASPSKNPGCELHIDHIVPWSQGGETVEENLRTLCSNCNLGRSNKE